MKPGSVLIDLAAGRGAEYEGQRGGNCPLTEADKVVVKHGVTIATLDGGGVCWAR